MKTCISCLQAKPLSEYHVDRRKVDRHYPSCKPCRNNRIRELRLKDYDLSLEREKLARARKRLKPYHKEKTETYGLKCRYGITRDDKIRMFIEQGSRCAICHKSDFKSISSVHTDHNHSTGEIRGLLCGSCNKGLGLFSDSPSKLVKAIQYLTRGVKNE